MTRLIKKRRKLGEILVQKGKMEPDHLTNFLRLQKETGKPLGQMMLDEGISDQRGIVQSPG